MILRIDINGQRHELQIVPTWSLQRVLHDELHLSSVKKGCEQGECGSCTVLVDGVAVCSCIYPVARANGRTVTTIEGLINDRRLVALQRSFLTYGAVQCGYCTPGMLMSAYALVSTSRQPSDTDVRQGIAGNLCRCTGYQKIVGAILASAQQPAR